MNNNEVSLFSLETFTQIEKVAEMLSAGVSDVPAHLRNQKSRCMAVVMQAAIWNINPFILAQKTYFVHGKIDYEAQLISAVALRSNATSSRFFYEFIGDWDKHNPRIKETERGLGARCGAVLRGEKEVTWSEIVRLEYITTRNSSLWLSCTKQQLAYNATKLWCRLYVPEILLGVSEYYDVDATQQADAQVSADIALDKAQQNDFQSDFIEDALSIDLSSIELEKEQVIISNSFSSKELAQDLSSALNNFDKSSTQSKEYLDALAGLKELKTVFDYIRLRTAVITSLSKMSSQEVEHITSLMKEASKLYSS